MIQGVAFHHAVDVWESHGRVHSEEEIVALFVEQWTSMFNSLREKWPNPSDWLTGGRTKAETDWENRYNRGIQQVKDYMTWAISERDLWRVIEVVPGVYGAELPFRIELGNALVVGFIDQTIEWRNGAITVRDLKTGNKLPASPFQLAVYRLGLSANFGIEVSHGDYFMSKNMAPTALEDLTRYTPSVVSRWFENMDTAVNMGFFLPNPGEACNICGVKKFCTVKGTEYDTYPILRREPENGPEVP